LQDADVELEVRLDGSTVAFRDLLALQPDHILSFNYSLDRPLRCYVNGESSLEGRIVNSGRGRGFRVTALPEESVK
jgi:flagellar motor switch/type III secretory pathway protein FliN